MPFASAISTPIGWLLSKIRTVLPANACPTRTGMLLPVRRSLLETPVSLAGSIDSWGAARAKAPAVAGLGPGRTGLGALLSSGSGQTAGYQVILTGWPRLITVLPGGAETLVLADGEDGLPDKSMDVLLMSEELWAVPTETIVVLKAGD